MSKQSRQAIARNQKYNQLEEQPRPQSWSARMPAYAGTVMEARGTGKKQTAPTNL